MIADDMMSFIKSDIIVFGIGVLLFIIGTLWFVFRKIIWIIVPISSCFFSVIIMMGILGLLGWKVTVISSNFIALMLILTMAMNIHISVRYLQFKKENPKAKGKLLLHTNWQEGWDIPKLIKEKGIDNNDILTTYFCGDCKNYQVKPFASDSKKNGEEQPCSACGGEKSCNTSSVHVGPSEKQLNEIYNLMDVYCHPFTSGGQELPIQEAKLCELITLVTNYSCGEDCASEDSGGMPLSWNEYREPGTQFIKASTSPHSISSKLERVFKMSDQKRNLLGKKAREFTIEN